MLKKKQIIAKNLLGRPNIQGIIAHWDNRTEEWFRSSILRQIFVKGPGFLYAYDSQLYRDLTDMVQAGLLENKKIPMEKGKPESYYWSFAF